jgi:hypothetical protein
VNSQQLAVISVLLLTILCLCGCEGLRYAATEAQKQNAWLHREVCAAAADASIDEEASPELCGLTAIAHEQSGAFVLDYGLPEMTQYSQSGTGFGPVNHGQDDRATLGAVAMQARADSLRKPDVFELADGAIELGIAIAGLVGGVYGLRIAGYLKQAKEKSKALKEIVEGNELFKQLWPEQADRFKEAQQKQSPATKQIVTELKTG